MIARLPLLALLLALTACSGSDPLEGSTPPTRQFTDLHHQEQAQQQFAISDPLERPNKYLYKFNAQLDRYVLIPIVDAYTYVTPRFLRTRVSYFFANLGEITNFTNAVLQGSPGKAGTTLGRFAINTTAGVLGIFEVADAVGLTRQPEDFGQTLGVWGAGPGPYLVLPFFGPSNLRDATGTLVDLVTLTVLVPSDIQDETAYKVAFYGMQPLDMRYQNTFRYFESGTPFEYEFVRYINTKGRELKIEQ